jgi:replicative DNA helicase
MFQNSMEAWPIAKTEGVTALTFGDPMRRKLWELADAACAEFNGQCDGLMVLDMLPPDTGDGLLSRDKVFSIIEDLINKTPTTAYLLNYIALARDAEKKRRGKKMCSEYQHMFDDHLSSADDLLAQAANSLSSLTSQTSSAKRTVRQIADAVVDTWTQTATGTVVGIPTGIDYLDAAIGAILPSYIVIISGPPGAAKTTLARCIAENVAKSGRKVAIKSLEQTEEQLVGAMMAAEAQVTVSTMNQVAATPEEQSARAPKLLAVTNAAHVVATWPLAICDRPCNVSELRAWCFQQVQQGAQLLEIDYLQRVLADAGEKWNDEQRVSHVMAVVWEIAKRSGVPVIGLASENYQGQTRHSGQVQYDAHIRIRIVKHDDHDAFTYPAYVIEFEKSRFAPSGFTVTVFWHNGRLISQEAWDEVQVQHALHGQHGAPEPAAHVAQAGPVESDLPFHT